MIHPVIAYPKHSSTEPIAIYYGKRNYVDIGRYNQDVTVVFNDEVHAWSIIDRLYRIIRRIVYGRYVDIETFTMHMRTTPTSTFNVERNRHNIQYCYALSFIKIFAPNYARWKDTKHDTVEYAKVNYAHDIYPTIYVRTWNHAMSNSEGLTPYVWNLYSAITRDYCTFPIKHGFLNRINVERKYRNRRK